MRKLLQTRDTVNEKFKVSPYSRNLNSKFSASYTQMTITFDVLDRFQENKVWQTVQTMNNILKSSTKCKDLDMEMY